MAIYHFGKVQIINRATGKGAVVSSAYISAEKIHNDYDNITHDYTRKTGVVYKEIMLCDNAPKKWENRETLWNEVEKIEKAKDGQLARSFDIGLQREFSFEENKNLVREFVKNNYVDKGMCADICIHDKRDGNPHAHIMLTMRKVDENGKFSAKAEKEYLCRDKEGNEKYFNAKELKENNDFEKIYKCRYKNDYQNLTNTQLKSEEYKNYKKISKYPLDRKIDKCADWNNPNNVELWRKEWADINNKLFEEKGLNIKIDHRSYERQGIEKIPTIHEGRSAREIEKKGRVSDRMEINRDIEKQNKNINDIQADIKKLGEIEKQLKELQQENEKPQIKKQENNKSIEELKKEREVLNNKYQEVNNKHNMCVDCVKKCDLIKEYKNKIENEKKYKNNLGFFKKSEKRNVDDRINKLNSAIANTENSILSIKNQLFSSGGSSPMTKAEMIEEVQKIEMQRINIENQLKQNEREIREEQERAIREQLENEKRQKELLEQEENKNKNIDERPIESGKAPKENIKMSDEERIKILEQANTIYQQLKIQIIKDPNDKRLIESAKQVKKVLDKYNKPMKAVNKTINNNKSKGMER